MNAAGFLTVALLAAFAPLHVQEAAHTPPPSATATQDADSAAAAVVHEQVQADEAHGASESVDIITPHITDSHELEYPCFKAGLACHVELPRWAPLHIGPVTLDLSPTKHVVWMLIAATTVAIVLIAAARAHQRHHHRSGIPRGFSGAIEALVLYMRNEVVLKNVGPHGEAFVPFVLTLFFFILTANLFGLIPYGSTATGNISVTATLALITFLVVEIAGMRAQGAGYLKTIFFWPHDMPLWMRIPMTIIMTPVEIFGKFTKPLALAIRLFANMTAGHVVVLALIGLIFTFGSYFIAAAPVVMSVGIMLLELFVAFLQAFIFSLLASVFIGQIRVAHH